MDKPLPFFNWSLARARDAARDNFARARINIIFTVLVFSLLKAVVVILVAAQYGQWPQVVRAAVVLVLHTVLIKILLYKPSRLNVLAHIMLVMGGLLVWSNVFMFAHRINVPSMQMVAMMALCSFYTLGSTWGVVYSTVGAMAVLTFVITNNGISYTGNAPQQLASPGFEIMVVLNFITIIMAHHLFLRAFNSNFREKEDLNEQLRLAAAEARELAESRSKFLSTMSHELRTPLNSVVGITEMLLEDKPEERQKDNLKILQQSANDLLSLINNVLDLNKIDANKLVLEQVTFHLGSFMRNISAGLKVKASYKHLNFRLEIDERLEPLYVVGDPTRLSQVIYNLAGNAIKFTDRGSVTVRLESLEQTAQRLDALFTVKDTGPGIPSDKQATIFEPFTQAGADTARRFGGTGLGLSIVKQVLGLMGSSIQLESSPASGTIFTFALSFAIANEPAITGEATPANIINISNLKLLVAEDTHANQVIIKKQLTKLGLDAVIVDNGQQAYEAYIAGSFDAILVDLHMPVLDGYGTIKQIRELKDPVKANVPIIAFTASVTEQQQILQAGFDDFLYKPVNMAELRKKLERLVINVQM